MKLQLSLGITSNPRTWPILDGRVVPDAIDPLVTPCDPSELFWRQLRFGDFDVSEMSMSSLMMIRAQGDDRFIGLPVFTTRQFFHTKILVRRDARINAPADLKGKRVGVPEYQQTAALWGRGALKHEVGVDASEIEWWMERTEEVSHGGATGFKPPPGVKLNRIPADESMASMLVSGKLDAALHYIAANNLVDRSKVNLDERADGHYLFPDRAAEGRRYFAKTGLYPINHGMVVRRSIAERHPWVVLNLYNAFLAAKDRWLAAVGEAVQSHLLLGLLPQEAAAALRQDPFPYGVVANRKVLEAIAQYSHEQGLTPRMLSLDEVFPANTLAL